MKRKSDILKFLSGQMTDKEESEFNERVQQDPKLQKHLIWLIAFSGAMEDISVDEERREWAKAVKRLRMLMAIIILMIILTIGLTVFFCLR
ncbi:MAG: hypothetical protein KDD50_16665 [Bdellovibrionales bacterium]|nr:hypothetical protein [Bdellovibrionales bacterium]